ncbi:MAG: SCP2 sterol-binding domain-containing protein [Desulfobacter sp.]|nr:MAG: SCP2 sterol-binding domain-containing protein [Desulfobacter sp.]
MENKIRVADIFNTMAERFRPEGAEGISASFGYEIKDTGAWTLEIDRGKMRLRSDLAVDCDVKIRADKDIFIGLNTGSVDTMEAITSRKLIVKGDMQAFSRLPGMFKKIIPGGDEADNDQELIVLKKIISVDQKFSTGPVMGKFLKVLKDKTILAIKCPECGRLQSPPREVCAVCRVRNDHWVNIGPRGEMRMLEYCYYSSPDPLTGEARQAPYGSVGILLDGCKDEEVFWHLLRPDQLDQVKMGIVLGEKIIPGTRLRPVWADHRTGSIEDIQYFEIDE